MFVFSFALSGFSILVILSLFSPLLFSVSYFMFLFWEAVKTFVELSKKCHSFEPWEKFVPIPLARRKKILQYKFVRSVFKAMTSWGSKIRFFFNLLFRRKLIFMTLSKSEKQTRGFISNSSHSPFPTQEVDFLFKMKFVSFESFRRSERTFRLIETFHFCFFFFQLQICRSLSHSVILVLLLKYLKSHSAHLLLKRILWQSCLKKNHFLF